MKNIIQRTKNRLGPLWWYVLFLFVANRFGDVVNAVTTLWLVPQHVTQDELGAVLPLTQFGAAMGLPLSIFVATFLKYASTYSARGEFGKLKSLLRASFVLAFVVFAVMMLAATVILPFVFVRMRVENGMLGVLIVTSGVLGSLSLIFASAVQARKKFGVQVFVSLFSAPIRFVTMLVCMPIRALSGYFVGSITPQIFSIGAALFGLRKELGPGVKAEPFWREDRHEILRYATPIAIGAVIGMLGIVEVFVIRKQLTAFESGGYFIISRFAEIGCFAGAAITLILFPLASENFEKNQETPRMLYQAMGATAAFGLGLVALFALFGGHILRLTQTWADYANLYPQMAMLTFILAARMVCACFFSYERACRRFGYMVYTSVNLVAEAAFLYAITGYTFFANWLPASVMHAIEKLNPCRLDFVLSVMLANTLANLACVGVQLWRRRKKVETEK